MDAITRASIDECISAVSDLFDSVFAPIDQWSIAVEEYVAALRGTLTRAGIDTLMENLVMRELAREQGSVIGAGFVATPGFIADAEWHLAWWLGGLNTFGVGSEAPRIRRLDAVEDALNESFRDYTTLEWWRVPIRTGQRHITGPYVDYLCTDDYTLTLTKPVRQGKATIGVVGADLYVADVERELLPRLRAIGSSVTLVNSSGRVVLSTDMHLPTGSLLRLEGLTDALSNRDDSVLSSRLAGGQEVISCGKTGLAVVI